MKGKASEQVRTYINANGPVITTVNRHVIEQDGMYFPDLDGSGELKVFDDWRKTPQERAEAYVKELTTEEKIAQLFISDWRMGKYPGPGQDPSKIQLDDAGILDEGELHARTIFGQQDLPSTSTMVKEWFNRHIILRASALPEDIADYMNQLNALAEECEHFIPFIASSNSRNENGEAVFGMNDGAGAFTTWPGTLGIAAAVKGNGTELIDRFAACVRRQWRASGLRKGYMYMADVTTDPRWQRTYGTFGEDTGLIADIFSRLVPGIQGSDTGVTADGVAMTVKHFPGGGARDNGFDPHYSAGQWNVYETEGSLQKYHLPTFRAAIAAHPSAIMPYYSKPGAWKSAEQKDEQGNPIVMEPYGFAYNKIFIDGLLRKQLGFDGYVNSDTGITHNMCWGVEALDVPERIGFAVNHSGVDLISGGFDQKDGMEAYLRASNDYYETHNVPEGFAKEDIVLSEEALNRAVTRTLKEMFTLGLFDNPFVDAKKASEAFGRSEDLAEAMKVHQQSVVLLKNDGTLPLKKNGRKLYVECLNKNEKTGAQINEVLKAAFGDYVLCDDYQEADDAVLFIYPQSGNYFSATQGYLELDICKDKMVPDVDEKGCPKDTMHAETTLPQYDHMVEVAEAVHAHGGKVITLVNFTLAWLVGNAEEISDVLLAGFDTDPKAVVDIITGTVQPCGKLPLTLPRNDAVLSVNKDGVCVSRNDVPGYDKDLYMPEDMKDENGKAYAYRDHVGNYYELNFGLTSEE